MNHTLLYRSLKGAPALLLIILGTSQGRLTNRALEIESGYSDKTIARGLDVLQQLGLVDRKPAGWGTVEGVQLTMFPAWLQDDQSRRISDSDVNYLIDSDSIDSIDNENLLTDRKKSDIAPAADPDLDPGVMAALAAAGIYEPTRGQLAALDHITQELVESWEKHLKQTKKERYTPGLLVWAIRSGDDPPAGENYKKYTSGEYAEYYEN